MLSGLHSLRRGLGEEDLFEGKQEQQSSAAERKSNL